MITFNLDSREIKYKQNIIPRHLVAPSAVSVGPVATFGDVLPQPLPTPSAPTNTPDAVKTFASPHWAEPVW